MYFKICGGFATNAMKILHECQKAEMIKAKKKGLEKKLLSLAGEKYSLLPSNFIDQFWFDRLLTAKLKK